MSITTLDQLRNSLVPTLESIPNPPFLGAFAYGDCMEEEFQPKQQPFDVGLAFESVNPRDLPDLTALLKAFSKNNARLGFLFTPAKIISAGDTFPLEFLNISQRSFVLQGTSPLQGFRPNPKSLRHQCERDLRGLVMHLHREYVLHQGSPKELQKLLAFTLPRFQPIFRGIYWLFNDSQYPANSKTCTAFIDSHWQLNGILAQVSQPPVDSLILHKLAGDYISGMEKVMNTIDHMEVQS